MKVKSRLVVLPAILSVLVLTGCATKGDIEALRSEISALQQTSSEALAEAKAARELANANRLETESTKSMAQSAARQAEENEMMINKAFENAMKK